MTTSIDIINELEIEEQTINLIGMTSKELSEVILELNNSEKDRIKALEMLYESDEDIAMELVYRLKSILELSGIKVIENYLVRLASDSEIPVNVKIYIAKEISAHEDLVEPIGPDDTEEEIKEIKERNRKVREGNKSRKESVSNILNLICANMENLATPSRVDVIKMLMKDNRFIDQAIEYFTELVNDTKIECSFRYKTLLSIEKLDIEYHTDILFNKFNDKDFVQKVFTRFSSLAKREFPNFKTDLDNELFYQLLVRHLHYGEILEISYGKKFEKYEKALIHIQLAFLNNPNNMTHYRNLSAQYLLQKYKSKLEADITDNIENTLLTFATDEELDYNIRADSADIILQLGIEENKVKARKIINNLGVKDNCHATIYENAQNVHTKEVEESVREILEFFATLPLLKINNQTISFEYVEKMVNEILDKQKKDIKEINNYSKFTCDYCGTNLESALRIKNKCFRSKTCYNKYKRDEKIILALERISLDRALYSKYNITLKNVLVKLWSYIIGHKYEEEMKKRLIEELEEMSGTCSSGFLSRLVNVVSGFGDFNICISWEEQIIGNLTGRINAEIRKITDTEGIFRKQKIEDIVILNLQGTGKILEICKQLKPQDINGEKIVQTYLSENPEKLTEECLENFAENVLNELTVNTSNFSCRQNFSLFFRSVIPKIREDMYKEFKEHLDDTSFDLYMRKALMRYEGIR